LALSYCFALIGTIDVVDSMAPPGGITVQGVYRLMNDSNVSVLLMDVRSCGDFKCSHIKGIDCINVPADCLQPGLIFIVIVAKQLNFSCYS
jgi:hypothetical protein